MVDLSRPDNAAKEAPPPPPAPAPAPKGGFLEGLLEKTQAAFPEANVMARMQVVKQKSINLVEFVSFPWGILRNCFASKYSLLIFSTILCFDTSRLLSLSVIYLFFFHLWACRLKRWTRPSRMRGCSKNWTTIRFRPPTKQATVHPKVMPHLWHQPQQMQMALKLQPVHKKNPSRNWKNSCRLLRNARGSRFSNVPGVILVFYVLGSGISHI